MATITENLKTIKDSTTAIKQAIIDKGGEVGDLTTYADAITNLPSGEADPNPTAEKNAVTFYDYDGTIRYSYTAEEFLALTEMPPLPTQKGLICQEWNWSYEDAIAYVAEYGVLDVGATYITDDGKTRLYIRIAAEGRMDVPLNIQQTIANGVTIDWGDGSATETLEGTGKVNTTHRYASIGDYVISLDVAEGCTLKLGANSNEYGVIGSAENKFPRRYLKKAEIGERVTSLAGNPFTACDSFLYVTIPNNVTDGSSNVFYRAANIHAVIVPKNMNNAFGNWFHGTSICVFIMNTKTSIVGDAFRTSPCLEQIIIPGKVTSIRAYCFSSCYLFTSIIFPKSVINIGAYTFASCTGMAFYDFSHHTAVPTLENTNAFSSIPDDCKIIVPDVLYDEWIAATNWSAYATYTIKKSEWDNLKQGGSL